MKLSILITSISERHSLLSRLLSILEPQLTSQVEVLIYRDNREKPFGDKVNRLVSEAKGEYVVLIDDDDYVTDDYVKEILKAIKSKPDFVGYKLEAKDNGNPWFVISHDGSHKGQWTGVRSEERGISPKCPIKREIFIKFPFGNSYTSDQHWINAVEESGLAKDCVFIDKCLYIYDFWKDTTAWGGKGYRDVGEYLINEEKFTWL